MNETPPSRPRLVPAPRWAKVALVALLAFTLIRGGVQAMTVPAFWGPDEDYHFLYVEYLTTQHALPSPGKPLYPAEYGEIARVTDYLSYCCGPRKRFEGDPKASVRELSRLPASAREPTQLGRGVGVLHPPLYHLFGAAVNAGLGDSSALTRVAAVKWVTSLFGVLAVYFAWVLAAQLFREERLRLLTTFLVAVQPMVMFLAGITNHDSALIAFFTAALAMMLFILRVAPRARQGAWLGGAVALALLVKSTALVLIPLACLAYLGQGLAHRGHWREIARSAATAGGIVVALAGWWYVRSIVVEGSATGATAPIGGQTPSGSSIGEIVHWAREWTAYTYRTYWWHFIWTDAPNGSRELYLPAVVGGIGIFGLLWFWLSRFRRFFSPSDPRVRQIALLVLAALALYLPLLIVDIRRRAAGLGFFVSGGRYLLPAYAGVAAMFVIGIRQLTPRIARPAVLSAVAVLAAWFCWRVWTVNYVERYFGDASWDELFRRMSFDRPEFVTPATYWIAFGLMAAALLVAIAAVVLERRTTQGVRAAPADEPTVPRIHAGAR